MGDFCVVVTMPLTFSLLARSIILCSTAFSAVAFAQANSQLKPVEVIPAWKKFRGDRRLLTALFSRNGWIVGGVTNILTLFLIGGRVEQVQSRQRWLMITAVGTSNGELFALRWQPVGAGTPPDDP